MMDCQGRKKNLETNGEEESLASARCAPLNRYAKESQGKKASRYAYVRHLAPYYFVGHTRRHPSLDIIWPSVLVECVPCLDWPDAVKKAQALYRTYEKQYGPFCRKEKGWITLKRKDIMVEQPLPTYSYDPALVRKV